MHHEDNFATAKLCSAGVLTIGYGHTTTFGFPKVVPGMKISQPEAIILLYKDTKKVYDGIYPTVKQLDILQQAALVSFAYNIGIEAFDKSAVAIRLRDWKDPPDNLWQYECLEMHLLRWDKIGKTVAPGLAHRRESEAWILLWQQHLMESVVYSVPYIAKLGIIKIIAN
jgi:lysozyme